MKYCFDFLWITENHVKKNVTEIYPTFLVDNNTTDLMVRGNDFYAVWLEDRKLWSTNEQDLIRRVDNELDKYVEDNKERLASDHVVVKHMRNGDTKMINKFHDYCKNQMRESYHDLDEKIIFSNMETKKKDYASKTLDYPLEKTDISAYDELMSVLYSPAERAKLEWAIGSIVSGDSKKIQKFMVLYGAAGTGKSTVLNIVQQLFKGYYSVFDAKAIGSNNNSFALEPFKNNPLVAIQHDGDLSRIEDNTRLNSIVSHEEMIVNEKFKSTYTSQFKAFLFMGTNRPVKITDARSGIIRRLIDVSPTGDKVHHMTYQKLMKQITFELGGIAWHCLQVYLDNPTKYDDYIPASMLGASNDFYNFVLDSYYIFKNEDPISLKQAWEMYNVFCSDTNVLYKMPQRAFKEELKTYFRDYNESVYENGTRIRKVYSGFRTEQFRNDLVDSEIPDENLIKFTKRKSTLDHDLSGCRAQYASDKETPLKKWAEVDTMLSDLDTSKLHYVKPPKNHIVIDFDIPGEDGAKSFERNLREASKWPPTYAELSKSGAGIHLHYIYDGDTSLLSRSYDEHIEIKVFNGNASLRRKLTKCNGEPISMINSGLPLKGERQMVNFEAFTNEKAIRTLIERNLNKEVHPATKPSIDFIHHILNEAYDSDLSYDVSDMRGRIISFAAQSTNNAEYCTKLVGRMKFKSKDNAENIESKKPIVFYDVEVFPNLFLVNWKYEGADQKVVRMINPTPEDIEDLIKFKLIGFNCRRYDNHILYGRLIGKTNQELYEISQKIVNGDRNAFFGEAYNLSYTDVYDFSSKKQSLKKFEIELGIHHHELGLPWDEPVPEDKWQLVAEYCDDDVIATEAVFNARKADFTARQILADVAGMSVNDTTNSLTTRIIFGKNRNPQNEFNYRDMGEVDDQTVYDTLFGFDEHIAFTEDRKPVFPGYTFDNGKSVYRGEEVGEGGYVYAEPGIYGKVALLDVASMHPTSIIQENLFGNEYTKRFADIYNARLAIKHKEFSKAKKMLGGKLEPYLRDEATAKDLAQALKIAINSVYGLTAAKFDNPFRDVRNKDNIVAKRGALFMINLKHAVQEKGYQVAHIKTDSIKIPNADKEIIDFVMEFGKLYGYVFEHEATYERMCLVNNAVYVAKEAGGHWSATGTQFQVPYVFKTLFSKEPIEFQDMCETKSVTTALYIDVGTEECPNRRFVGKVGEFCPMVEGAGGGKLVREKNGKYDNATGAKGYLWMESEMVKELGKEDQIDRSYYQKMVDDAVDTISKFGDYEWFVNEDNDPEIP